MAGIEVEGLVVGYGAGPDVLGGVSLSAPEGEVTALLGINGAGKTTLFLCIAGLLQPRQGEVRVGGLSVEEQRRECSRRLGFVPEQSLLYPQLSALENINRFALLWDVPAAEAQDRGEAWLRSTDLWGARNSLVSSYSRGMRQRLALGCALLHQPRALLLDEPFNGLDMGSALQLRELLKQKAADGCAVLLSSHQPEAVDAVSDRLALLSGGTIVRRLSRDELREAGGTARVFLEAEGERVQPKAASARADSTESSA